MTTPWLLRRPLVFLPRTCVRLMAAVPVVGMADEEEAADAIRRTHARHVGGRATRCEAIFELVWVGGRSVSSPAAGLCRCDARRVGLCWVGWLTSSKRFGDGSLDEPADAVN